MTKYKDTPVVEDVEECNKVSARNLDFLLDLLKFGFVSQVYKKTCEYVKSGYGTEKVSI